MGETAVFVDIDNTIVNGATLTIFGQYFLFRKRINILFFIRLLYWYLQYKRNKLHEFDHVLSHMADVTADWDVPSTDAMLLKCFNEKIKCRLYVDMLARLRTHHAEGCKIFFVSSTILPIAELLVKYLGFGVPITTIPKIQGNHYTAEIEGEVCYGPEKIARIKRILDKENIDLTQSYTYTDHISDLPLLELVGHPVVVNPGCKLKKIALARGWEIINPRIMQK